MLNSMENMLTDVRVGRVKLIRFLCGVSPASEILENQPFEFENLFCKITELTRICPFPSVQRMFQIQGH